VLFKSPVYSQASGSIAGIVYSRNAGGMYTRARAMPTNPNTDAQQAVRDAMRFLTDTWTNGMADVLREAWNTYAFNTPTLNKLGEPTHKTGQNMFIRGNIPRVQAGLVVATTAPVIFDLGTFTAPSSLAADASADTITFAINNLEEWANEDGAAMLIYQSRPQNATRTFGKGPFQLATIVLGDGTTPPASPVTFASLFPLAEDQKVFIQARVTRVDGRLSGKANPTVIVGP
jgi:hypothetical protein